MAEIRVDLDLGFDPVAAKARLLDWLVAEGEVEPELSAFVACRRQLKTAPAGMDECIGLAVARAHDKRHLAKSGKSDGEITPTCEALPCHTRAISEALDALDYYALNRNGPLAQLADMVAEALAGLKGLPVKGLCGALRNKLDHTRQTADRFTANPDNPPLMLHVAHTSHLLSALERVLWEAGQVSVKPPERAPVTLEDITFPFFTAEKVLELIEAIVHAQGLAVKIHAEFQRMLSPRTHSKRRGRPTFGLLIEIRSILHRGGFSAARIAWLVPDGPGETDEQREAAIQRVKHAVRADRERTASRQRSERSRLQRN